jgi:hypothetical protein
MRDNYMRELKTQGEEMTSGAGASKRKEWVHFKAMTFLKPHVGTRQ